MFAYVYLCPSVVLVEWIHTFSYLASSAVYYFDSTLLIYPVKLERR